MSVTKTLSVAQSVTKEPWLADRVVVVTGGSRGIGRAIVCELAQRGAQVVFTYVQQREAAEALTVQLQREGSDVLALQADATILKDAQGVVAQAVERFGRLDGLVNNAGIVRDKALMLMDAADWQAVIDTNLTGVFNACRAAIVTFMKQRSGRIVNITSVAGLVGMSRQVNYSASKAGVIGFTKALAKEVAPYGIRVNSVTPNRIGSPVGEDVVPESRYVKNLVGRRGTPKDIAAAVLFLCSEESEFITAADLLVDGGAMASRI